MATKLYPPYIKGTLPAFWLNKDGTNSVVTGADIKIPFSMNTSVKESEFQGFLLILRTTSTGSYLFSPIYSSNYSVAENIIKFHLEADAASLLNEGQYYKIQIAYCTENQTPGYYSTVGIIKCTSEPEVRINNLNMESTNFFTNDYVGIYNQEKCVDLSEKVYSYEFIVYNELGEQVYTTGEQLHKTVYDTEYNFSIDTVTINNFIPDKKTYSIQYKVVTMNGLELATPKYRITNENLVSPNDDIQIVPQPDNDSGIINVTFKGVNDLEKSYHYILDIDSIPNSEKIFLYKLVNTSFESFDENEKYYVYNNILQIYEKQEGITEFDTDKQYYTYKFERFRPDTAHYTLKYTLSNLLSLLTTNKVNFLKTHTLFKRYNINSQRFYYKVEKNEDLTFNPIDEYYYLNTDIEENNIDLSNINLYEVRKYEKIGNCNDLIKIVPYKDIEDVDLSQYDILYSEPSESLYYGSYLLSRADETDNYTTWVNIARFRLDEQRPSGFNLKDFTIEHGRKYKYALQQYNIWGLYSARIYSEPVEAAFEDMYLFDGEKTLKIRYNPEVNTFKTTILEAKSDTLGGRFPYITRNGETYYKEFPVGGLLAQELDVDNSFSNFYQGEAHRHSTWHTNENLPENALRDMRDFTDQNIALERNFKLNVLDWLNNGKPKLFKSPYEGNYIVRLMQVSLSPVKELGRMLHSFTSTAYEIAEFNYENLINYGFINTQAPSDFVGLWKTYNLSDYNEDVIEIIFDQNLMSFTIQDLMPGDIISIKYAGESSWTDIMIGITGSYTYTNVDKGITAIRIQQPENGKITGSLNCYYQGVRITKFDSITAMQLKTIPSQQFIGVNPRLIGFKQQYRNITSWGTTEDLYSELAEYNFRDDILDCTKLENNKYFVIKGKESEFEKAVQNFDPSNILDRINTTLYDHQVNKIELLNIEQAKFRLREIIPVYAKQLYGESLNAIGEKDSLFKYKEGSGIFEVSTSPYGYPHPIEELNHFEMIDPYAIYQVFYKVAGYNNWMSAKYSIVPKTSQISDYSDYYVLNENDIFEQVNDYYERVSSQYNNFIDLINEAKNNQNLFKLTPDLEIYYDPYYRTWLLDDYDPTFTINRDSLIYKKEKKYSPDQTIKVDLSTIKEKYYPNGTLTNIQSINIGNGVIAELTFQIKVIDYYTESADKEVAAAKQAYLDARDEYNSLKTSHSIIANAEYLYQKNLALKKVYTDLLDGAGHAKINKIDQNIINLLLANENEIELLNLLSFYLITYINKELDVDIVEKLLAYKDKYKDEENYGFNDIQIYVQEETNYHFVQNKEIISFTLEDNQLIQENNFNDADEEKNIYYQISIENNKNLYFALPKNYNNESELMPCCLQDYDNSYYVAETDTNSTVVSYQIEPVQIEDILVIKQELLDKEDFEQVKNNTYFISSEKIEYSESEIAKTFFEKESIEDIISDFPTLTEGIQNKLSDLQKAIEDFEIEKNNLEETYNIKKVEYINTYNNLMVQVDNYNKFVYQYWALQELLYWLDNKYVETPDQKPIDMIDVNTGETIKETYYIKAIPENGIKIGTTATSDYYNIQDIQLQNLYYYQPETINTTAVYDMNNSLLGYTNIDTRFTGGGSYITGCSIYNKPIAVLNTELYPEAEIPIFDTKDSLTPKKWMSEILIQNYTTTGTSYIIGDNYSTDIEERVYKVIYNEESLPKKRCDIPIYNINTISENGHINSTTFIGYIATATYAIGTQCFRYQEDSEGIYDSSYELIPILLTKSEYSNVQTHSTLPENIAEDDIWFPVAIINLEPSETTSTEEFDIENIHYKRIGYMKETEDNKYNVQDYGLTFFNKPMVLNTNGNNIVLNEDKQYYHKINDLSFELISFSDLMNVNEVYNNCSYKILAKSKKENNSTYTLWALIDGTLTQVELNEEYESTQIFKFKKGNTVQNTELSIHDLLLPSSANHQEKWVEPILEADLTDYYFEGNQYVLTTNQKNSIKSEIFNTPVYKTNVDDSPNIQFFIEKNWESKYTTPGSPYNGVLYYPKLYLTQEQKNEINENREIYDYPVYYINGTLMGYTTTAIAATYSYGIGYKIGDPFKGESVLLTTEELQALKDYNVENKSPYNIPIFIEGNNNVPRYTNSRLLKIYSKKEYILNTEIFDPQKDYYIKDKNDDKNYIKKENLQGFANNENYYIKLIPTYQYLNNQEQIAKNISIDIYTQLPTTSKTYEVQFLNNRNIIIGYTKNNLISTYTRLTHEEQRYLIDAVKINNNYYLLSAAKLNVLSNTLNLDEGFTVPVYKNNYNNFVNQEFADKYKYQNEYSIAYGKFSDDFVFYDSNQKIQFYNKLDKVLIQNMFTNSSNEQQTELDNLNSNANKAFSASEKLYQNTKIFLDKVEVYKKIINDQQNDDELDEYLSNLIVENVKDIIINLYSLKNNYFIINTDQFILTEDKENYLNQILDWYKKIYNIIIKNENNTIDFDIFYKKQFQQYFDKMLHTLVYSTDNPSKIRDDCLGIGGIYQLLLEEEEALTYSSNNNNPDTHGGRSSTGIKNLIQLTCYFDDLKLLLSENNSSNISENINGEIVYYKLPILSAVLENYFPNNKKLQIYDIVQQNYQEYNFPNYFYEYNNHPIQIFLDELKGYSTNDVNRFNAEVNISTYLHRRQFPFIVSSGSRNIENLSSTFLFNPLSEKYKDIFITTNELSNKAFFSNQEIYKQKNILNLNILLINYLVNFISNSGQGYSGEEFMQSLLEKQISLQQSINNYKDLIKVSPLNTLLIQAEKELLNNEIEVFYKNVDGENNILADMSAQMILPNTSRNYYCINNLYPQSINFDENLLLQITSVLNINDIYDLDTQGIYYEYLKQIVVHNLENLYILLEQGNTLLDLYKALYSNYNEKYNEYNRIYNIYKSIYDQYENTPELKFYKEQDEFSIDEKRLKVKTAWWNFLNILDIKYSAERERGMYI